MSFNKLRELRDRFEQQWINGGFIFGYENEINENHNNDYPLLVVLPPTSELPSTEGDVQEEYTFECLVVKPYYQNQAGSLDVVFSLLEQEGLTWLQRVLDSYTNKDRKSTRLNSSHLVISYAVFRLKKKNTKNVS